MKKWLIGATLVFGPTLAVEARADDLSSIRVSLLARDEDLKTDHFSVGSHLGLHLRSPELVPGLSAEAELSLFVQTAPGGSIWLQDNASFVRLVWRPESWSEAEGLSLTVLPLSSTRLYLGYEFPATWGRTVYNNNRPLGLLATGIGVPGLAVRLTREHWYAFAAAKSTLTFGFNNVSGPVEFERLAMGMAGAGVDVLPELRLEAAGALVQHGVIPGSTPPERKERASTRGLSGRVLYHAGAPVGRSVDFTLYGQDPEVFETLFAPQEYPGGVSASLSLEASHLVQTLERPDGSGSTVDQEADTVALQARLQVDFLRVHALGLYRSASFIVSDTPGLPPFRAFGDPADAQPELLVSAGMDHHFSEPRLTPGLVVRMVWPATVDSSVVFSGGNNPQPLPEGRRVVLRGPNELSVLPEGRERKPVLTAKATLRWDIGSSVSALGEAFYTHDPNRTVLREEENEVAQPVLDRPSAVGLIALLQARF